MSNHYLIRLSPLRTGAGEDVARQAHLNYLKEVLAKNKLVLAGPVTDPERAFGVIILETESEDEAKQIMNDDPLVKGGFRKPELFPFRIAVARGQ